MTVFAYLKFMADLHHVADVEDRVDEVLELVHMEERSESFISSLSKGMRQRIGLAQALIHKPDVLILDEPTIGLDPVQIVEVRNLIRELGKDHTILLSTHILSEAQQVCNRVLIINKGKIVAEDTPERLQARLAGVQKVLLKVAGDSDGLEEVVSGVSGVVRVSPSVDGGLELEMLPGQDIRPHLARTVVAANFDLLELRQVSISLEDIFIELTREEPEPPSISEDIHTLDEAAADENEEYPEE